MESDKEEGGSETKGSDEQQGGGGKAVKSYECNFCKRGFSNAQALGGHMNIHRKDKAKLKQSNSSHQPPSFNTTSINWMSTSLLELDDHLHHHHHENINVHLRKKLPLFAETPTNICDEIDDEEDKPNNVKVPSSSSTTTIASATQSSSSDLDLELRLGPHPHHPSPTTKFF